MAKDCVACSTSGPDQVCKQIICPEHDEQTCRLDIAVLRFQLLISSVCFLLPQRFSVQFEAPKVFKCGPADIELPGRRRRVQAKPHVNRVSSNQPPLSERIPETTKRGRLDVVLGSRPLSR